MQKCISVQFYCIILLNIERNDMNAFLNIEIAVFNNLSGKTRNISENYGSKGRESHSNCK